MADSGANMLAAMNNFADPFLRIPCTAHRINLAVSDLLTIKKIKIKSTIYWIIITLTTSLL